MQLAGLLGWRKQQRYKALEDDGVPVLDAQPLASGPREAVSTAAAQCAQPSDAAAAAGSEPAHRGLIR
jgi:hypothetical protein